MQAHRDRCGRWALLAVAMGVMFFLAKLAAQSPPAKDSPPAKEGAPATPPKVAFALMDRHGHATPMRTYAAHTGGGNTDVAQPSKDTLIITMTGVATAGPFPCRGSAASLDFELDQHFAIVSIDPKLKSAKLTVEAQVIGLLRGDKNGGSAAVSTADMVIGSDGTGFLALSFESHAVNGADNLSINDHKGPVSMQVVPGNYHLLQKFHIDAAHAPSIPGKAAAAEFAPDPALDATWISVKDPFHGASKKEFGFRAVLRIEAE